MCDKIKLFIATYCSCFIDMQIKKICILVWNRFKHGFSNTAVFSTRFSLGFETHPPDQNKMLWLGKSCMNN